MSSVRHQWARPVFLRTLPRRPTRHLFLGKRKGATHRLYDADGPDDGPVFLTRRLLVSQPCTSSITLN